jgi:hypothetical protein
MLRNRLPHVDKELTPTLIIRRSRGRINVMTIVANRLLTIRKRKANQPNIKQTYGAGSNIGYGFNKGGYPLNRNGVPIDSKGRNALAGSIR